MSICRSALLSVSLRWSDSTFTKPWVAASTRKVFTALAPASARIRSRWRASCAGTVSTCGLQLHGVDVVAHYRRARLHASGRRQMRGICAARVQLLRIRPRSSRGSSSQAPVPATPCTRRVRAVCRDTRKPYNMNLNWLLRSSARTCLVPEVLLYLVTATKNWCATVSLLGIPTRSCAAQTHSVTLCHFKTHRRRRCRRPRTLPSPPRTRHRV